MSLYEHDKTVGNYIRTEYLTDAQAAQIKADGYYIRKLA